MCLPNILFHLDRQTYRQTDRDTISATIAGTTDASAMPAKRGNMKGLLKLRDPALYPDYLHKHRPEKQNRK